MFQSIGERVNTLVSFVLCRVKRCLKFRLVSVSQTDQILVISVGAALVIFVGGAVFSTFENWTYFDACYYCVITLTTIGFGDFVALQQKDSLTSNPYYVAFVIMYIVIGLTIISAAMNLLVLRFLTMNTEDEKRDEIEEKHAAATAAVLDGDVIHPSIYGNHPSIIPVVHCGGSGGGGGGGRDGRGAVSSSGDGGIDSEEASVCSCTCYSRRVASDVRSSGLRREPLVGGGSSGVSSSSSVSRNGSGRSGRMLRGTALRSSIQSLHHAPSFQPLHGGPPHLYYDAVTDYSPSRDESVSPAAKPGGAKGFVYEKMNGFQGSTITCVTYDYEYAKKRLSI